MVGTGPDVWAVKLWKLWDWVYFCKACWVTVFHLHLKKNKGQQVKLG